MSTGKSAVGGSRIIPDWVRAYETMAEWHERRTVRNVLAGNLDRARWSAEEAAMSRHLAYEFNDTMIIAATALRG